MTSLKKQAVSDIKWLVGSSFLQKARNLGIKDTWKYSKKDLIRTIQSKEGNFACFGTAKNSCGQMHCCWRPVCLD